MKDEEYARLSGNAEYYKKEIQDEVKLWLDSNWNLFGEDRPEVVADFVKEVAQFFYAYGISVGEKRENARMIGKIAKLLSE